MTPGDSSLNSCPEVDSCALCLVLRTPNLGSEGSIFQNKEGRFVLLPAGNGSALRRTLCYSSFLSIASDDSLGFGKKPLTLGTEVTTDGGGFCSS